MIRSGRGANRGQGALDKSPTDPVEDAPGPVEAAWMQILLSSSLDSSMTLLCLLSDDSM